MKEQIVFRTLNPEANITNTCFPLHEMFLISKEWMTRSISTNNKTETFLIVNFKLNTTEK